MWFPDRTLITFAQISQIRRRLAPSPPRRCHQTATKTYIIEFRSSTRTIAARQPPYAHVPRGGYFMPRLPVLRRYSSADSNRAIRLSTSFCELPRFSSLSIIFCRKQRTSKLVIVIYNGEVRISDLKECLLRLRRWLAFTVR